MQNKFNLAKALAGEAFECEDGDKVIKWIYCEEAIDYPITCYIKNKQGIINPSAYTREGYYHKNNPDCGVNLIMSPKTITKWINHIKINIGRIISDDKGEEL